MSATGARPAEGFLALDLVHCWLQARCNTTHICAGLLSPSKWTQRLAWTESL